MRSDLTPPPQITAIVPSLCEASRRASLMRAISSLLEQSGASVTPLVVVNGNRYDPGLLEELNKRDDLNVLYREKGNLPAAVRAGREHVSTPYFCFLDDDDEYLPGALSTRLAPMLRDSSVDVVVTNGYRSSDGKDTIVVSDFSIAQHAPLEGLLIQNWLASCGGLYRTAAVPPSMFDPDFRYLEWTLTAFKLALEYNVVLLDTPTYRIFDSPQSLSKDPAYRFAGVKLIDRILEFDMAPSVKRKLRIKKGRSLHGLSDHFLHQGDPTRAWKYHLASMTTPGGALQYGAYTRKLVALSLKVLFGS